jgi:hypothetical protein
VVGQDSLTRFDKPKNQHQKGKLFKKTSYPHNPNQVSNPNQQKQNPNQQKQNPTQQKQNPNPQKQNPNQNKPQHNKPKHPPTQSRPGGYKHTPKPENPDANK